MEYVKKIKIDTNRVRNQTMYKGCFHKDNSCDGKTSRAHSVQKSKYLQNTSDNGEVLGIDFGDFELNNKGLLKRIGIKKASTFTGFCNYHDRTIFSPIENVDYMANNIEQEFLFAYRACALAYYERYSSYGMIKEDLRRHNEVDCVSNELLIKAILYSGHLQQLEKLRLEINEYLDNADYEKIKTELIIWDAEYDITATSMFFIRKDVEGNLVNDSYSKRYLFLYNFSTKWEDLCIVELF